MDIATLGLRLMGRVLAVGIVFAPGATLAASEMILKLDGVPGESTVSGHGREIDVLQWTWGASGALPRATRTTSQPFCAQALSVTKFVDLATPVLLARAAAGQVIPAGRLVVRRIGEKPFEYLVIDLSDVRVVSAQTGGSQHEDRHLEFVSLTFSAATVTYKPQDEVGGGAGGEVSVTVSPACS